jgi:excinuclease UvrABC nuclease subunit
MGYFKMSIFKPGRPKKGNPKNVRGEYRIRTKKTKKVIYVGIANDLARRLADHKRSGFFRWWQHDFEWMDAKPDTPWNALQQHERDSIKKHKPRRNRNIGGGGRRPKSG